MFTAKVNIAVFAAFRFVIGNARHVIAEFKGVRGERHGDRARSGWQKRQDVATSGKARLSLLVKNVAARE